MRSRQRKLRPVFRLLTAVTLFVWLGAQALCQTQCLFEDCHGESNNGHHASEIGAGHHADEGATDFVARTLLYALQHREESLSSALLRAANLELKRFNRGLAVLDTIITLAPLLGLLGTVTGMIHAFGLLGGELDAPTAITGGIAEALIATAFGLGIAITALIPFNYLNARLEQARHEIEDAATHLELLLVKTPKTECAFRASQP